MDAGRVLRQARRRANLTQRELAGRSGVPQPAIARIESGAVVPRLDTLDRLLEACGGSLEVRPRLGIGVDRTAMRELLGLTPGERARLAAEEAGKLGELLRRVRR